MVKPITWTPLELAALQAAANKNKKRQSVKLILSDFPGRTIDAVYAKSRVEGLSVGAQPRWSENEIIKLRASKTLQEVVDMTGRSETAVFLKAKRLKVKLDCRDYLKRRSRRAVASNKLVSVRKSNR